MTPRSRVACSSDGASQVPCSSFILMTILQNGFGHFPMSCCTCKKKKKKCLYGFCKGCDGSGVSNLPKNGCLFFVPPILVLGVTVLPLGRDWKEVVTCAGVGGQCQAPWLPLRPLLTVLFGYCVLACAVSFVLAIKSVRSADFSP